jgi:hypothetical protein
MIYTVTPTEFEIYDESKTLAAKVSMFDEGAANVEIQTVLDRTSFDLLVPAIQQALSLMKLEGDI